MAIIEATIAQTSPLQCCLADAAKYIATRGSRLQNVCVLAERDAVRGAAIPNRSVFDQRVGKCAAENGGAVDALAPRKM